MQFSMRKHRTLSRLLIIDRPDRVRFTAYTAALGLLLGGYLYTVPFAAEHMCFFISLPLAAAVSAWFGWKWSTDSKASYTLPHILGLAVLLTLASTWLNWVILGAVQKLMDNSWSPSWLAAVAYILIVQTALSLWMMGWLGILLYSICAWLVVKTSAEL
jgi:hypothetical protein